MGFSSIKSVCIRNQPEIFLNCTSLAFSIITFIQYNKSQQLDNYWKKIIFWKNSLHKVTEFQNQITWKYTSQFLCTISEKNLQYRRIEAKKYGGPRRKWWGVDSVCKSKPTKLSRKPAAVHTNPSDLNAQERTGRQKQNQTRILYCLGQISVSWILNQLFLVLRDNDWVQELSTAHQNVVLLHRIQEVVQREYKATST